MKLLILFLSLTTLSTWANNVSLPGASIAGEITLSGMLKNLIYKDSIPYGGLLSYHGYEAIDFSSLYSKNTKAQ